MNKKILIVDDEPFIRQGLKILINFSFLYLLDSQEKIDYNLLVFEDKSYKLFLLASHRWCKMTKMLMMVSLQS